MDLELTNNKSRVAVTWGAGDGSDKNVAYAEEYHWGNKNQWDFKVVYLRSDTLIRMAITDPSLPVDAKIRFKWNRDRQYWGKWCPYLAGSGSATLLPAYTAPFRMSEVSYPDGTPLVGAVGHNGMPETSKRDRYFRAILGPNGDEYHTLMFAIDQDDWAIINQPGYRDRVSAIDGKSILIVVDPKAPAFCPRVTGTGQFFTNQPKAFWTPRVVDQTTVFSAGAAGTVTFQLVDIFGNNVSYRINGGSWVHVGASTVTLTQDDFAAGSNTLEYYYEGNESFARTRTLIKDPAFPSAVESHGQWLWNPEKVGGSSTWEEVVERTNRRFPNNVKTSWRGTTTLGSGLEKWVSASYPSENGGKGQRSCDAGAVLRNTFMAKFYGWGWKFNAAHTKSVGDWAKEMLLETKMSVDQMGFEGDHSADPIPNRTRHYRGYYDSMPLLKALYAYDIFTADFKSTQVAGGLTAVEDYYVRDRLAAFAYEGMLWGMDGTMTSGGAPGMWGGARMLLAQQIAMVMPEYSSPLWGTSGFGAVQTTYPDCPFGAGQQLTWKQALWDRDTELGEFPKLKWRFTPGDLFTDAPTVKNGVTYPAYSWKDSFGYFDPGIMQVHCVVWQVIAARFFNRRDDRFLAAMQNATTDPGMWRLGAGTVQPNRARYPMFGFMNSTFPDLAANALDWGLALPSTSAYRLGAYTEDACVFSIAFLEDTWGSGEPVVTVPAFSLNPLSQTVSVGDTVTLSVLATGTNPIAYQWKKNGVDISGQTSTILTLSSVTTAATGSYTCTATNSAGSATSSAAVVTVQALPPDPGALPPMRSALAPLYAVQF